jgi:serine/threonine-protein kinase
MLTFHHHRAKGPVPILMVPMDRADPKPQAFLEGDYSAEGASFSRDGRYVAFVSQQSGPYEVYIRPFPGPGGQVTVSVGGAQEPVWAKNGDLFYRSLDGERMFAVKVNTEPALKVGTAVQLFEGKYFISPTRSPRPQYDVTRDGQRMLMLAPGDGTDSNGAHSRIVVVQNWHEELKRLVTTQP